MFELIKKKGEPVEKYFTGKKFQVQKYGKVIFSFLFKNE